MKVVIGVAVLAALLNPQVMPADVAAQTAPDQVCTIGGIAVPEGAEVPDDIPLVMSCFDSFDEAQSFIEAGAPGDLEQLIGVDGAAGRSAAAAAATVTIGRVWTGGSRSGSELIHWGTGSGCYGVTFGFPSLPAGWNDNIRSAEGYSNCWATHYENASYGGSRLNCIPYCSNLGFLDGQSSSIVYRPVGTYG